jgi:hypothetical protein
MAILDPSSFNAVFGSFDRLVIQWGSLNLFLDCAWCLGMPEEEHGTKETNCWSATSTQLQLWHGSRTDLR